VIVVVGEELRRQGGLLLAREVDEWRRILVADESLDVLPQSIHVGLAHRVRCVGQWNDEQQRQNTHDLHLPGSASWGPRGAADALPPASHVSRSASRPIADVLSGPPTAEAQSTCKVLRASEVPGMRTASSAGAKCPISPLRARSVGTDSSLTNSRASRHSEDVETGYECSAL
jgi:hypothetical protein